VSEPLRIERLIVVAKPPRGSSETRGGLGINGQRILVRPATRSAGPVDDVTGVDSIGQCLGVSYGAEGSAQRGVGSDA